ncbi:MAG: sigma-70 family RNA polymerase sigma factor [Clostridia bacterium]|nr:sigma-70 family RNA polymerase sigma factor [Clostridia bacterium]
MSPQESAGALKNGYSANIELIRAAQSEGGESEAAMRATAELLELNKGLLKKIVMRFRDRGVELEDLMQIGTIGMIKAIRSFDLERGTCFSTYAVPLIFGEIRRHIRDEGPIKVGRYYKRLGAELMNCKNRILTEEGRDAHVSELAALCGVSAEEAAMAMDALSPIASLSDSAYGDEEGVELEATIADEEASTESERLIDKIALSQAIGEMPALWQQIVTFRYYRGMTQQQVAAALGVTQVKVSREEKKILEHLREHMRN